MAYCQFIIGRRVISVSLWELIPQLDSVLVSRSIHHWQFWLWMKCWIHDYLGNGI
ncbi:hypothetical protein BACUNI_03898 [Bacteroides uniformis ATCC 8492]|uniref:Uncharacterized protein n=1 Tax=Bacteroides uniformis (strain ATCC 8492 / DSM 6597 / CCUG 4942 / CIP 103695 / JCM 5828 / KCTC 5204 / NCTC 13054 / VPI 0061) TaxID=411479 RepID=A0ABC9N6P0_BACUC|nr:hypothetical protein BACUNI_03898 [Bacteroides uniformis ATCC 8492]